MCVCVSAMKYQITRQSTHSITSQNRHRPKKKRRYTLDFIKIETFLVLVAIHIVMCDDGAADDDDEQKCTNNKDAAIRIRRSSTIRATKKKIKTKKNTTMYHHNNNNNENNVFEIVFFSSSSRCRILESHVARTRAQVPDVLAE